VRRAGGRQPARERTRDRAGDLVVVFSPKGGTGCTTVAANLALGLQEVSSTERDVALLDGNLQFGDVGVMLDMRPDRSIADLVDRIDELDDDLLSSVMSTHGSGVRVLLAPPRPETAESLLARRSSENGARPAVQDVLSSMRKSFDIIVVDTWSWVDDLTLMLFDAATLIVLVVTPDIPAVKSARLFLELTSKLDYPVEDILLVVNGADRRGSLRASQIEKAMMHVTAEIPYDERTALGAANRGVPVIQRERNAPISEGLIALAGIVFERLLERDEEREENEGARDKETRGVGGTGLLRLKEAFSRG